MLKVESVNQYYGGSHILRGLSFEAWCAENSVVPSAARNATFGQSKGPKGRALLARMIQASRARSRLE